MDSRLKEHPLTRRDFLKRMVMISGGLLLPPWLANACDFSVKASPTPASNVANKEKNNAPNLDLKINEVEFWKNVRGDGRFELLPDATDKSKLLPLSQNIYTGKSSTLFRVAVNRPMADFLIRQAKLLNPSIRTNIIFVEDWGEGDKVSGEGGFTGITSDQTEQNVIIWLKRAAWHAFNTADVKRLPYKGYFQGFLSFYASSWTVHELGHAGAENKALWKKGQQIPQELFDLTHPQIFAFQKQYDNLYDQAGKRGLAAGTLPIALEPTMELDKLRNQIFTEAKEKGFE